MGSKKILTVSIFIILFLSGTLGTVTFQKDGGLHSSKTMASTSTTPDHKEYPQPDRVETRDISDFTQMDIYYDYQMDHDVPPSDLIFHLDGTDYQDEPVQIEIRLKRPDSENITLMDDLIGENKTIEERYSFFRSPRSRENIYEFGLKFQDGYPGYEEGYEQYELNRAAFGKADEEIITDPEILKGEYTIQITLVGKDLNIDYGKNDTILKVLGLPPGPVRDLEAESSDKEITLDWKSPVDKGGSEVIRYNIYRATTNEPFKYLDHVSADTTTYTDIDVTSRSIYFYKVAPINLDTEGVERGDMSGDIQNSHWRSNCERIIAFPSSDEKKTSSSRAYRWWMDYSYLTESHIQERMKADAEVDEIDGQGKCLYRIDEKGEEDGLKRFAYEGGYYSSGEANISLDYEDTTFDIEAEVKETSIDFSGELWVNSSEEGKNNDKTVYSIKRQTFESSGSVDMKYEYRYKSGGKRQTSIVDLDMNWSLSMEMDFEHNVGWLSVDSNEVYHYGVSNWNFSGNLSSDVDLEIENQGVYSNETVDIDRNYSTSISGDTTMYGSIYSTSYSRLYSPILGSARMGYYEVLDGIQGIDNNEMGSSIYFQEHKRRVYFSTNNKQAQTSEKALYKKQYLDPTTMPGLLSILEAGFIRANYTHSDHMEELIQKEIKRTIHNNPHRFDDMNAQQLESWRENETERLSYKYHNEVLTEPSWHIWDQQSGPDGTIPYLTEAPILDVVGFFESESVGKSEVDKFLDDKEGYTIDEKEGINWDWIVLSALVLITVFLVTIYRSRKKERA